MASVLILGGGVIGVTSAYYLLKQGFDVTIIDRQSSVGQETSFANAGQISPGYSTPWAAPGIPSKAIKWLFEKHAPLAIRPDGSAFQSIWISQMLKNCTNQRYAINKERMMRVAEYSRDCLRAMRDEIGIHYEQRTLGTIQLFRKQSQLDAVNRDIKVLEELNVHYELLTAEALGKVEPALANHQSSIGNLLGGLRLPNDETGDCHLFTTKLAEHIQTLGAQFLFNHSVHHIEHKNNAVSAIIANGEKFTADYYLICLGSYSRKFGQMLQLDLPIYPVKGYSLTIPIVNESKAPISTVLDESYKIAITRFDNRIRVGGMAELTGYNLTLNPKRKQTLTMVVKDLFDGGDLSQAKFWTGLRPMTPDGTPIIGQGNLNNVFINTGHGTLGWTMACGSGKLIADTMAGKACDISTEGLSYLRYK